MIYLILFFSSFILVLLEQGKSTGFILKPLRILFPIVLILFIGLRQVGPDYLSYKEIFDDISNQKGTFEPFFYYFMIFMKSMGGSFLLFMFSIATISILIKVYVIRKYSPYFFLSILLALPVVFISDMGQIRFSLALATVWLTLPYCEENRPWSFVMVMLVAMTMHVSSVVFFLAYFMRSINLKLSAMFLIWIICYLIGSRLDKGFTDSLVDTLAKDTMIDAKVDIYQEEGSAMGRYTIPILGTVFKIITLGLIYYSSMADKVLKTFLLNMFFLSGCIFLFFSYNEILTLRLSLYSFAFEAITIPCILYAMKDRLLYWILLLSFVVKAFYQYYMTIFIRNEEAHLPYKNVLDKFF